jgi:hypothetical protein
MLKTCAQSSELSRPLPLACSSDESLLICPSQDNADSLCGLAQPPSTKYRPPCIGGRPASTVPQSVFWGKTAKKPKHRYRRPRHVVLGQVATGSRRVASFVFLKAPSRKADFRRSPIIARSPCAIHGQVSGGIGCIVYKEGFMTYCRTLGLHIALSARPGPVDKLPHSVR